MTLSLADLFILASILQGFFLGLAVRFAPALRSPANNHLGHFLLLLSALTLLGWQEWDLFWPDYVWSLMWEFLLPLFLFRYFLEVLEHPYRTAKWLRWLYAPFWIILFFDLIFDGAFSFDLYELPFPADHPGYSFYDSLLDSMALWWNIFVIGWAFVLAQRNTTAPAAKRTWLLRFGGALLGVLVVWFLSDYVQSRTGIEDPYAMIWIALSLFFWYTAYAGVYQLRIVDERAEIGALRKEESVAQLVEVSSSGNDYSDALRGLMEEQHLYRNPDLGRQQVAERLGISEGYLSKVMTTQVGQPFADYVNAYRIEEAKRLLSTPAFSPYSLEAIGLEAGFRSRSAFYASFKKATGLTPGAFRKQG